MCLSSVFVVMAPNELGRRFPWWCSPWRFRWGFSSRRSHQSIASAGGPTSRRSSALSTSLPSRHGERELPTLLLGTTLLITCSVFRAATFVLLCRTKLAILKSTALSYSVVQLCRTTVLHNTIMLHHAALAYCTIQHNRSVSYNTGILVYHTGRTLSYCAKQHYRSVSYNTVILLYHTDTTLSYCVMQHYHTLSCNTIILYHTTLSFCTIQHEHTVSCTIILHNTTLSYWFLP